MKNVDIESVHTGTRLNKYILTEEIGHGGHGIVYRAYHEKNTSEAVAVKIIEDSGNIDSLLIEPELLSRLDHPNIIKLKDFFIHAGKLVLVTEYIDGVNLQSYLSKRGKLTFEEVGIFITQMADALNHAHTNNIIHRDIKLSNIIFTGGSQNPKFVLVDFGISRMAEGIQRVKRVAGTYYYMAPEQLRGRPCEQSDLWSLGVCAYTLLTGIKPFEGKTEEDVFKKILFSIPKLPSEAVRGIDSDLENIILQLLEKQLINRTASATELLNQLKLWKKSSVSLLTKYNRLIHAKDTTTPQVWEQKNLAATRINGILFGIFFALTMLLKGFLGVAISTGGLVVFYLGQSKQKKIYTLLGIFLLIVGLSTTFIILILLYTANLTFCTDSGQSIAGCEYLSLYVKQMSSDNNPFSFLRIFVIYFLANVKRLKENLFLRRALRNASLDDKEIISLLKKYVNLNLANINIRQKYIELLLLNSQFREAIVESKLSLEVDPYNFGLNLLLANSYFEVGLYDECIQVCDGYLAVTGYSFEFSDLKNGCEKLLGRQYEV
jgi:serine/threonine-protein kinase